MQNKNYSSESALGVALFQRLRKGKFMKALARFAIGASACALLSACGGGSSGGGVNSTPTPPPAAFSSFSAVQSGSSTSINGITREGSVAIETTGAILPAGVSTPTEGTGSATFTLNASRQITGLSITGAQSNVTFNSSNSSSTPLTLNGQALATAVSNSSGTDNALFGDPYALGFNYQTFGVWGTGLARGATGKFGAVSVGAKTSAGSVPTTGTATFSGYAGGIYTNGAINRYAATATFNVNFGSRSVAISTSNQVLTDIATPNNPMNVGYLSLSGTMTYAAGSSSFSGNLSATGQTALVPLTGTGSGTFYGPSANELGGTFFLRGSTTTLVGGFGAKQ